ncbi:hypothetical protein [Streptomyces sp. NPDC056983]|uniref:hypothetical protein n=1 Tax=Streptomyces sp. NPDC056983 TaxID=3345987 RepID=UPI003630DB4D
MTVPPVMSLDRNAETGRALRTRSVPVNDLSPSRAARRAAASSPAHAHRAPARIQ